jgi:hypothetical protein
LYEFEEVTVTEVVGNLDVVGCAVIFDFLEFCAFKIGDIVPPVEEDSIIIVVGGVDTF